MTSAQLSNGRKVAGLSQAQAAPRLKISQPYLSQLERGQREVPEALAKRALRVYRMSPTALPIKVPGEYFGQTQSGHPARLARSLAALGYPAFSHLRGGRKVNPAELVLDVLSHQDLDVRLVEAVPWVLLAYPNLNWYWLIREAKCLNLQNRLGFVVYMARMLATDPQTNSTLARVEQELDQARLAAEDTLCNASMPKAERHWVASARTDAARHWNLLTGLKPDHLPYAKNTDGVRFL
jgi:transcriptional regulator with XRE-family HTH domain